MRFDYIKFEPRDIWIGLFWDRAERSIHYSGMPGPPLQMIETSFYLCPVPMIVIKWTRLSLKVLKGGEE